MATKGTVRWFDDAKGYGMIAPESGSTKEVMVHASDLNGTRSLKSGDRVSFDLQNTNQGATAKNVRKA